MAKKDIYELELHESVLISQQKSGKYSDTTIATRVPGGWIYETTSIIEVGVQSNAIAINAVFVPFNKEFEKPLI